MSSINPQLAPRRVGVASPTTTRRDEPAGVGKLVTAFVLGGIGGWVLENALSRRPRNSHLFGKKLVPFLPVYAVGTSAIVGAAPHITNVPVLARAVIYAAGLSGLELAACQIDRSMGRASWAYGDDRSCVDLPHAAAWGLLGLGVERIAAE
jgi:hypothetical protein